MPKRALKIHPKDNLIVALENMQAGDVASDGHLSWRINSRVGVKHKFTEAAIEKGQLLYLYGIVVGEATEDIPAGAWVNTTNIRHNTQDYQVRPSGYQWESPDISDWQHATFEGYYRSDGQVGTRNYWLVVPLVFCQNRNIRVLEEAFQYELGYRQVNPYRFLVREYVDQSKSGSGMTAVPVVQGNEWTTDQRLFKNLDGIKFLLHEGGCGGTREDSQLLCQLLAGYIHHPNVAGATVLSLGCQHAQVALLQKEIRRKNPHFNKSLLIFEQQAFGSEKEMLSKAIFETLTLLEKADQMERAPAPLQHLTLGLECGGSDGFSGITANPLIGKVSDMIVALGGKSILSEFPELCGVEQELIDRSRDVKTAEKFVRLMETYNAAAHNIGSGFDMNPSPGNIKDGLITDAIKSAGAATKGGKAPVSCVLDYGEYSCESGLQLLCTPGNDVESTTGLAGSGANLILFSTGLGTPTGNPVCPVMKISTNTDLADRIKDIIDFDAGRLISQNISLDVLRDQLLAQIIEVASGRQATKAQMLDQDDFIPWKRGISL